MYGPLAQRCTGSGLGLRTEPEVDRRREDIVISLADLSSTAMAFQREEAIMEPLIAIHT